MHTFNFTRPFALVLRVLAIACLAIAAPTSDVHADPGSAAAVHAVGNVPDTALIKDTIATHFPSATSTIDETGGSTLKQDSLNCLMDGSYCMSNSDCCSELCVVFESSPGVCLYH